jgi:hypothetical protein
MCVLMAAFMPGVMEIVTVDNVMTDVAHGNGNYLERLDRFEEWMLAQDFHEIEPEHLFTDGVYHRRGVVKAGDFVLGHVHTEDHYTIFTKGRALLCLDGNIQEIRAPAILHAKAGQRKLAYVIEDLYGENLHTNPDNETDVAKLEARLLQKSPAYKRWELENKQKAVA